MVERIDIERGLDKLASDEAGFAFQSLAVVLAKLRWPEFIASERHNDRGGSTRILGRAWSSVTFVRTAILLGFRPDTLHQRSDRELRCRRARLGAERSGFQQTLKTVV
jgi:hypothetical protein